MTVLPAARHRAGLAGALALVLAVGSAGCGGSGRSAGAGSVDSTGITATSVLVGSTQPLTGPDAPGQLEVAPATRAYFDWVNAHGGVHGRHILYTVRDDADDPAVALAATRRLVQHDHVAVVLGAAGVSGVAAHQSSAAYLASAGVPDLFPAGGFAPSLAAQGLLLARWVAAHPPVPGVGVLFRNDSDGRQGLAGVRAGLPGAVVSAQGYAGSDLSLDGPIARLRADGAGTVIALTTPAATAMAELSAQQQGWHPRWLVAGAGADPVAVRQALTALAVARGAKPGPPGAAPAGAGRRPVDGVVSDAYLPAASATGDGWVALFHRIWAASPAVRAAAPVFDGEVVQGMAQAELFTAALAAAGAHPGRAALLAAVRRGLPSAAGLLPLVPPGAGGGGGYSGAEIVVWSGAGWTALGPPEIVRGTSVRPFLEARPDPPADGVPGS